MFDLNMEIAKIRKTGEKKMITIPKKCDLEVGDYVKVFKISEDNQ